MCPLKLWVTLDFLPFIIEHKYNLKFGRPCFLSVWVVVLRKLYTCLILSQSWDPKFWSMVATQNLRSLLLPVATWLFGQLNRGRACLWSLWVVWWFVLTAYYLLLLTSEWVLGIPCSSLSAYSSATVRYKHSAGHQCYGQEEGGWPWPFVVTVWCKRKFVYWNTSPSLLVPPRKVYLFWSNLNLHSWIIPARPYHCLDGYGAASTWLEALESCYTGSSLVDGADGAKLIASLDLRLPHFF